jgi:dehydrogenase/reductase SDR family member 1
MGRAGSARESERVTRQRVAFVTGASRGVGKGIVQGLAAAGWRVYFTGRSSIAPTDAVGGTLEETVASIEGLPGQAIGLPCDHGNDDDVRAAFDRVADEAGRLDLLVNNFYTGPESIYDGRPFFQREPEEWNSLISTCLHGHYVASVHAARLMAPAKSGLIINISSFGGGAYLGHVLYGMQKAALDKMSHDMAVELRPHGVDALSLWLGPVMTEKVRAMNLTDLLGFPLEEAETPAFVGRVVASIADDPERAGLSGRTVIAAEYGSLHSIANEDGNQPPTLRDRLCSPQFDGVRV